MPYKYAFKYTFLTLITLAVLSLAAWTIYFSYPHSNTNIANHTSLLPDAYLEDVVAVILDKQGKPSIKIVTPKMIHYAKNDMTELSQPQVTLYRQSPQPWYITAQKAKAINGVDVVTFWDNVVIHHAADVKNPSTVIKTSVLTVQPEKQLAETPALITLTQSNLMVKAIGMDANMKSGDIKLLSQARGEYVPN